MEKLLNNIFLSINSYLSADLMYTDTLKTYNNFDAILNLIMFYMLFP